MINKYFNSIEILIGQFSQSILARLACTVLQPLKQNIIHLEKSSVNYYWD